jgi:hypothetical protein
MAPKTTAILRQEAKVSAWKLALDLFLQNSAGAAVSKRRFRFVK